MADRGKRRFNRIAGADALPMLGREVEECHEFLTIFLQAQRRLGVLWLIGFDEQIEGLSASSLVSACQMLWIAALAFG